MLLDVFNNNLNIIKKHLLIIGYIIIIMPRFCSECGSEIKDGGRFCPNCGKKAGARTAKVKEELSYSQLIKEIIYVEEDGRYRLSKAKIVGVLFFVYIILSSITYISPNGISIVVVTLIVLFAGLFWYGICRGIGYLVRTYLIK